MPPFPEIRPAKVSLVGHEVGQAAEEPEAGLALVDQVALVEEVAAYLKSKVSHKLVRANQI